MRSSSRSSLIVLEIAHGALVQLFMNHEGWLLFVLTLVLSPGSPLVDLIRGEKYH